MIVDGGRCRPRLVSLIECLALMHACFDIQRYIEYTIFDFALLAFPLFLIV